MKTVRYLPLFPLLLSVGTAMAQSNPSGSTDGRYQQLVVALEQSPIRDLESTYLRCARESEQRMLSIDEAAMCSIVSETLMKRRFAGDFDAMLSWWRQAKGN